MAKRLFTSESVTMGHPDKVADQISDAILDAVMAEDPHGRVACETMVNPERVVVAGEITTTAAINYEQVVRDTVRDIGYDDPALGFCADTCDVQVAFRPQSMDIARGVDRTEGLGAGDQGLMFGYACNETPELMPLPLQLARGLCESLTRLRQDNVVPWLRPDGKAQVTVEYEDGRPVRIDTVVVSAQHAPDILESTIHRAIREQVIESVLPAELLDGTTRYCINPTGSFVKGGPAADCGLTGRKIIVDTYGGRARHGGGAFSGKDCTKVDRSGAYMARYAAKNIVAAGLATECELQVAYAIGVAHPIGLTVDTFGTGRVSDTELERAVRRTFDFRPASMIEDLDLRRPIYRDTARSGHFGRSGDTLTWERIDRVDELLAELG